MNENPYELLPDIDSGGWWVAGPTDPPRLPKWVPPAKEIMEAICAALNAAYVRGKKESSQ